MADMSFKQVKEIVERLELTEITLKDMLGHIDSSTNNFKKSLNIQEEIINLIPKNDRKLNNMKMIVSLNIGLIVGLILGKYLL